MTVYERIENLRNSNKISQGKLEKELGFSNGSISKWKNSMPTLERLQKIADYFGVTVDYLMTGKEQTSAIPTLVLGSELNKIFEKLSTEMGMDKNVLITTFFEADFSNLPAEQLTLNEDNIRDHLKSIFNGDKKFPLIKKIAFNDDGNLSNEEYALKILLNARGYDLSSTNNDYVFEYPEGFSTITKSEVSLLLHSSIDYVEFGAKKLAERCLKSCLTEISLQKKSRKEHSPTPCLAAAHNDHLNEDGEMEKVKSDLAKLKKPNGK